MNKHTGNGKGIRFLRAILGHEGDECIMWPYTIIQNGYGMLGYNGNVLRANRLMCELAHGGPPTPRHEAAHNCGIKACVNPRHLSWKTPVANQADRRKHGTSGNPRGKFILTEAQVAEIRSLRGIETQQSLADRFGVTRETISQIMRGKIWNGNNGKQRPFQPDEMLLIMEGIAGRMTIEEIAKKTGRSYGSVQGKIYTTKRSAA